MKKDHPTVAIVGGGLGGLSLAALLQSDFKVDIYEQGNSFFRIGAGINLGPNLMHVLRKVGVADKLIAVGARPERWQSRQWDTGDLLLDLELGERAQHYYGEPYLTVHRGDFHATLLDAVKQDAVHFAKKLVKLETGTPNVLHFADGTRAEADIVVGADGIWSTVRELLVGPELPRYSGHVAFRGVIPSEAYGPGRVTNIMKWWAKDRMFLAYPVSKDFDQIVFVTSTPQKSWDEKTSWVPSDRDELRKVCAGFHADVQHMIDVAPTVTKWAEFDNEPLPFWSKGNVALIGDACHPMKPYLGQGAAMAIEDAAALSETLKKYPTSIEKAIGAYVQVRLDRSSKVQKVSREPTWLRDSADPDWVFGYNIFRDPLLTEAA